MRTQPKTPIQFSPNGTRIAFASATFGKSVLVTAPGDLGRYQMISPAARSLSEYFSNPTWSPDGNKIAYEGMQNGSKGIYTANADGTGLVRLAPGTTGTSPAWAW